MKHKRFSDEQVIGVLKEHEAGAKVDDICRRDHPHGGGDHLESLPRARRRAV